MPIATGSITLNGEAWGLPGPLSLADLLATLGLDEDAVAVERNRQIVRRPQWAATPIEPGDTVEIVRFVGGG